MKKPHQQWKSFFFSENWSANLRKLSAKYCKYQNTKIPKYSCWRFGARRLVSIHTRSVTKKFPEKFFKMLYPSDIFTTMWSPSKYSPFAAMHFSMRLFQFWKQRRNSSFGMLRTIRADSVFILFIDPKCSPRIGSFRRLNKKKSHGARSGKYVGCSRIVKAFLVKNAFTMYVVWGGTLSWLS